MAGSAANRGGVVVSYDPSIEHENFRWKARMRNHTGHGPSQAVAFDDLIAQIDIELKAARAARKTYQPDATE